MTSYRSMNLPLACANSKDRDRTPENEDSTVCFSHIQLLKERSTLKGKNVLPFRVDPFSERKTKRI